MYQTLNYSVTGISNHHWAATERSALTKPCNRKEGIKDKQRALMLPCRQGAGLRQGQCACCWACLSRATLLLGVRLHPSTAHMPCMSSNYYTARSAQRHVRLKSFFIPLSTLKTLVILLSPGRLEAAGPVRQQERACDEIQKGFVKDSNNKGGK